ncbi:MAG: hypothetical protein RQ754_04415 [Desulfuromonadales bacterium]|nr:hypothetical protein [Desulfuromonadales bacterium]
MFDNLIARAIVPVTIAVTGFVIFGCLLLYSFIKADMTTEALRNLDSCANTVVKSTHYAMMEDDRRSLQNIVANIGTRSDVELIHVYDQDGNVRYSGQAAEGSDSRTANFTRHNISLGTEIEHAVDHAGRHISVSLPILNEKKCSTSDCHFHPQDKRILGHLFISVSSEQLEKTLALLKSRMVVFSVMVLFMTVGGVTALLRINLFLPIIRLAHNVERAVHGVLEHELPKHGKKLGKLDHHVYQLVKQRDVAQQNLKGTRTPDGSIDERSN